MTPKQLNFLCTQRGVSEPTQQALYMHLFGGMKKYQASLKAGVLPQNLNRTLKRLQEFDAQIREVYGK